MTTYIEYSEDDDFLQVDSTVEEIDFFTKGILHKDFQRELTVRINILNKMLTDPQLKYSGRDYDVFRGGLRMAEEVKNLFIDIRDSFIDVKKESIENEKD